MYSHPGRSLVASAERRFGRLAIPHLIRWIAIFQLAVWALNLFVTSGGGDTSLMEYLILDQSKVYSGEVWRIITFVLIPRANNPLLILFVVFFLWFISDGLEREWGAFRVNLYVYATVGCMIIFGLIPVIGMLINFNTGFIIFTTMFLAFAAIYPDMTINLFGIIPVKCKWLAWADLAILLSFVLSLPLLILPIGFAFLPYMVVFFPGFLHDFRQRSQSASRLSSFKKDVSEATGDAFHTCDSCGKTDVSHPELEFRVTAEGDELCTECLPSAQTETPAEG